MLIQSRASRVNDVLTAREVNEIADAPAGTVREAISNAQTPPGLDLSRTGVEGATPSAATSPSAKKQPKLTVASISRDGKVSFEATQNFDQLKK